MKGIKVLGARAAFFGPGFFMGSALGLGGSLCWEY